MRGVQSQVLNWIGDKCSCTSQNFGKVDRNSETYTQRLRRQQFEYILKSQVSIKSKNPLASSKRSLKKTNNLDKSTNHRLCQKINQRQQTSIKHNCSNELYNSQKSRNLENRNFINNSVDSALQKSLAVGNSYEYMSAAEHNLSIKCSLPNNNNNKVINEIKDYNKDKDNNKDKDYNKEVKEQNENEGIVPSQVKLEQSRKRQGLQTGRTLVAETIKSYYIPSDIISYNKSIIDSNQKSHLRTISNQPQQFLQMRTFGKKVSNFFNFKPQIQSLVISSQVQNKNSEISYKLNSPKVIKLCISQLSEKNKDQQLQRYQKSFAERQKFIPNIQTSANISKNTI